ncbi:MAG: DUF393 domain-containing protein [Verrucomicrobiota bacterium]|nr:DUF393 domain-containing protein [Verrucomicrobiota bacterium]
MTHIIFFENHCPWCHENVKQLLAIDRTEAFLFAPLQGETAAEILTGSLAPLQGTQGLLLIENYQSTERKLFCGTRALLRAFWLSGGLWRVPGIFSFLPSLPSSKHRHHYPLRIPMRPGPDERFLP